MSNKKDVIFQEASAVHAQALLDFLGQVSQESDFLVLEQDIFQGEVAKLAQTLDEGSQSPYCFYLLAMLDEKVIGLSSLVISHHPKINHIGDIFLVVSKAYQGQKIGQILLEETIAWAEFQGFIRRLELTVQKRNKIALHIYEKFGFTIEGLKKRGAKTEDGEFLDVYLMGKLIDEIKR